MTANITVQLRRVFEVLSCFIDGSPGAPVVAVNQRLPAEEGGEPAYKFRPLFVNVTSVMTITDRDGGKA